MLNNCLKKHRENGYNIVERKQVCLTMKKEFKPSKNEKQPISLYFKKYSTESKGFISCSNETIKSEKYVVDKIEKSQNLKIRISMVWSNINRNIKSTRIY